jgi:predicted transcriptional regulator of viral defense system
MRSPPTSEQRLARELKRRGGIIRAHELFDAGVHPRTLYRLRDEGFLEVLSRGVYRVASAAPPPHLDLLTVAVRVPTAVVCLISALAFHGLTDEIPHEVMIALPRTTARPRIDSPPIRVFRFSVAVYEVGVEHHPIEGVDLKVYSPTKSILDCFRFRNRLGEDVAVQALARGLRTRKARPAALMEMAGPLRLRRVLAPYLQALT